MHPEIVTDAPGSCPKCGMALEPMTISIEEEENPELVDMTRRFWISVALTIPVVLSAMIGMSASRTWQWFELALTTPMVLWAGWPFFVRGWTSVINRSLNMFTLGTAAGWAWALLISAQRSGRGFFLVCFPRLFAVHPNWRRVADNFEAAAAITPLVLLGQVMELRRESHTSAAIKALPRDGSGNGANGLLLNSSETGRAARSSASRRPPARASRRENSRGRRGARRREQRG